MGRHDVYGGFSSGESMRVLIRELRSDERGVASTVGTIMALLVFLTFLSLIVNQYVPVWMKDSEAAHMNTALGNFGSLKGAIDLQVLASQAARNAGVFYIPTTGIYIMQLKLYNNALVMPLSVFRLQHAQVQIGVGDNTQSVQF